MLLQLLKSEEDASYKPVKKACTQLVDNLVEHILKYEESLAGKMDVCLLFLCCLGTFLVFETYIKFSI